MKNLDIDKIFDYIKNIYQCGISKYINVIEPKNFILDKNNFNRYNIASEFQRRYEFGHDYENTVARYIKNIIGKVYLLIEQFPDDESLKIEYIYIYELLRHGSWKNTDTDIDINSLTKISHQTIFSFGADCFDKDLNDKFDLTKIFLTRFINPFFDNLKLNNDLDIGLDIDLDWTKNYRKINDDYDLFVRICNYNESKNIAFTIKYLENDNKHKYLIKKYITCKEENNYGDIETKEHNLNKKCKSDNDVIDTIQHYLEKL
jgi:hypothetical protein